MPVDVEENQAGPSHPRKVVVMPEAFSAGENEDWHSWLKYFKNCSTLNSWNDEQKRNFLAVRLRGVAQQTYQDLNEAVQEGSFNGLAEALGHRFAPEERVELYKAELYARKRVPGEKLGVLAAHVRKLAKKAFPGASNEIVDQLAKDRFIDALVDKDLRIRIREGSPAKLDDAVSRAIQLEAIHEAENNKSTRAQPRVRAISRPEAAKTELSDPMIALLERNTAALETVVNLVQNLNTRGTKDAGRDERRQDQPRRRGTRNRECWICGKAGHFKADCPNRNEQSENC